MPAAMPTSIVATTVNRKGELQAVTTLAVLNLPADVTQRQFLNEINQSGFVGWYDYAYLPVNRTTSLCCGHAFVNFTTSEAAFTFEAAWTGSRRFGIAEDAQAINVVPSSVQGLRANMGKWTRSQVAKVKNLAILPFIACDSSREGEAVGWGSKDATTLAVRNLPSHIAQHDLLAEVDQSGFAGMYDFAYLPLNRETSVNHGYAFVNFKTKLAAAAFMACWCGSMRFDTAPGTKALNVVPSSVQGLQANMRRWNPEQLAKVKNPAFHPFIAPEAAPEVCRVDLARDATTLVVRNLPTHTTQEAFLDEVDRSGFVFTYDFAYLPVGRDTGLSRGHAFINFSTKDAAAAFATEWDKSTRFDMDSGGVSLSVVRSSLQGFDANVAKWSPERRAKVKNPKFHPFVGGTFVV